MNSGTVWYDPRYEGCGFVFVNNKHGAQVFFFGHTFGGDQFWMTGFGKPTDGIQMTFTSGNGFPTTVASHFENAGVLKVTGLEEGTLEVELEVDTWTVWDVGVDVSPSPPETNKRRFKCIPLEVSPE